MNTPQTLTLAQIKAYLTDVDLKGIAVVHQIYQELQAQGYAYAGWADGVATGNAITGQGV